MKISTILKKSLLSLLVLPALLIGTAGKASAQIPYQEGSSSTSSTPIFNQYYDVPVNNSGTVFNEADFVRLRTSNGTPTANAATNLFIDPVSSACNVGDKFDVRTYVHNGASANANGADGSGTAVAHNTKVKLVTPLGVTSKDFVFGSTISADHVASVSDTGTLTCGNNVRLELDSHVFTSTKTGWVDRGELDVNGSFKIGSRDADSGDVWGCWDERVMVVYTVKVVAAPAPIYTCDLLSVTKLADNKYRFSINYTANNGATFKDVTYVFGDGSTVTTTNTVEHTYSASTEVKNVVATANFMLNGATVSHTSDSCKAQVTLTKDNCKVPGKENLPKDSAQCKETPKELPNTGAGSTIAIFFGTTAVGAFIYRLRALRGTN